MEGAGKLWLLLLLSFYPCSAGMDWGRQDPGPLISTLFSSWSPSLPLPLRASAMTFEVEELPVRGRLWTARNRRAEGLG